MTVNVFHISQKVKCCFLSQSWVATQSFRHIDSWWAPVIVSNFQRIAHVHVVQVPGYFGDLWLGALHQRHKCPVAAISKWKTWSNYLEKKASWLLKTLRRRKLQNQIMRWCCSTAPSPQQPWKVFLKTVITVSFELEILELLQAVEDMYGALDEIYMIKCVFGTDILSCLSLSIC